VGSGNCASVAGVCQSTVSSIAAVDGIEGDSGGNGSPDICTSTCSNLSREESDEGISRGSSEAPGPSMFSRGAGIWGDDRQGISGSTDGILSADLADAEDDVADVVSNVSLGSSSKAATSCMVSTSKGEGGAVLSWISVWRSLAVDATSEDAPAAGVLPGLLREMPVCCIS